MSPSNDLLKLVLEHADALSQRAQLGFHDFDYRADAPLLLGLLIIHISMLGYLLTHRNDENSITACAVVSVLLTTFSAPINRLAAKYWSYIASKNYFDQQANFLLAFYSAPLVGIAIIGLFLQLRIVIRTAGNLARKQAAKAFKEKRASGKTQ